MQTIEEKKQNKDYGLLKIKCLVELYIKPGDLRFEKTWANLREKGQLSNCIECLG